MKCKHIVSNYEIRIRKTLRPFVKVKSLYDSDDNIANSKTIDRD